LVAAALAVAPPPPPSLAHVPLDSSPLFAAPQAALRRRQQEDLVRLFEGSPLQQQKPRQPSPSPSRRPPPARQPLPTAERANAALAALRAAEAAVDAGDFGLAEREYGRVVDSYGDLALSEYARFGQALLFYQRGDSARALAGLEDEARALTGRAEAHAALAALLWTERPQQLSRAELEFEVAGEFDARYADADWVARERHWPPRAVAALRRFLALG
jgi:hypothetical protein